MLNKKAITEQGFINLIMAVIVVILVAITAPVIARIFYGGGGELRTATVNLESLQTAVNQIVKEPGVFASAKMPLYVQENEYIIVAFNAEDNSIRSGCYEEYAKRPVACPAKRSCLCLYRDTFGKDFDSGAGENVPNPCKVFPENIVFLAPSDWNEICYEREECHKIKKWNFGFIKEENGKYIAGANSVNKANEIRHLIAPTPETHFLYENLLLYGECDGMVWNNPKAYIEKYSYQNKIYVLIARESFNTAVRESHFKTIYEPE